MNSITKISVTGLPAMVGIGIAWIGFRLIKNEKNIAKRKMELELQLGNKSFKGV